MTKLQLNGFRYSESDWSSISKCRSNDKAKDELLGANQNSHLNLFSNSNPERNRFPPLLEFDDKKQVRSQTAQPRKFFNDDLIVLRTPGLKKKN